MFSGRWLAITVSSEAQPGMMPLIPPLNPAKKCGSMKPVMIRTSASTSSRLRRAGDPFRIAPTGIIAAAASE